MSAPFVGDRSAAIHAAGDFQEAKLASLKNTLLTRTQDARAMKAMRHDPTDLEAQWGHKLHTLEFIRLLRSIQPYALIQPGQHPGNVYFCITVLDQLVEVCGCRYGIMPEWSKLSKFHEPLPRPSPKLVQTENGGIPVEHFTPDINPEDMIHTSAIETVRGWRTVLARYITAGHVPEAAAERVFGLTDRASWAALMGHLRDTRGILF